MQVSVWLMDSHTQPQFPDEQSEDGRFVRQQDAFRRWVSANGESDFPAAEGRYHLYVSWACPWAHRTIIVRHLKRLSEIIGMAVVDPIRDERGWAFRDGPGHSIDPINGFKFLSEAYAATDPNFDGRVTVPVLWDKETKKIVNNCEDDICRMFNDAFNAVARNKDVDLFPKEIEAKHSKLCDCLYDNVNNGVYKAGFATRQGPYEISCKKVFEALDELEKPLSKSRYLFDNRIVEADWRLFCTLVRFDVVYHGHFKCNIRRIIDYPNLQGYLMNLYQLPGIAETVNFDHIKRHYYMTHEKINPTRIAPIGPAL